MVGQIVAGLVARVSAGLRPACAALNDDAAEEMQKRLNAAHSALATLADETLSAPWIAALCYLAEDDSLHGLLAGRCTRLLLDDGALPVEAAATRLSRQLSRANPPAHAAAWIEGFLAGSGLLLLHQDRLWNLLDGWLASLTADHFTEVLPLLRRTFSTFAPPERRQMGELAKAGGGSGGAQVSAPAEEDLDESRADRLFPTLALLLGAAENDPKP
jgi:hypothetical protein